MPEPQLEVVGLKKDFPLRRSIGARLRGQQVEVVKAVDDVDLFVTKGEVHGLVGETGCGKSTLARCIAGLHQPTAGEIRVDGRVLSGRKQREISRRIQMVFQDPYSSLNPRMTVSQTVGEILRVLRRVPRRQVEGRVLETLNLVGFPLALANVYPRQLSGGLRQRVSIARAIAAEPDILLADEAVSALDVSVQATILNLLADLRQQLGLTILLITHDMAVVRHVSDKGGGHVPGPDRGARRRRERVRRSAPPLLSGSDQRGAAPASRSRHARARGARRPAQSHPAAIRLPLPPALPAVRRRVPQRDAGAAAGGRQRPARGCLPLRRLDRRDGGRENGRLMAAVRTADRCRL